MILKEEMRARSGCHDNDQRGSRCSSRCSSKEALNNLGFSSINGCGSELLGYPVGHQPSVVLGSGGIIKNFFKQQANEMSFSVGWR